MATETTILENAPTFANETAGLARWSTNYDHPAPFALFLDLIGYSDEHFGEPLFDLRQCSSKLGYMELGMLADALREYADNPRDVEGFVDTLMAADGMDDDE